MTDRNAQIEAFVENAGWGDAVVSHLAGDASNRRYLRLIRPSNAQRAVLMDAPPEKGEDVHPFVKIATYLTSVGLSAPHILHRDDDAGFLLLEDLGDALFASIVPRNPDLEDRLYSTAIDVLVHLHAQPAPDGLAPMIRPPPPRFRRWCSTGTCPARRTRPIARNGPGSRPVCRTFWPNMPPTAMSSSSATITRRIFCGCPIARGCPCRAAGFPGRDAGPPGL